MLSISGSRKPTVALALGISVAVAGWIVSAAAASPTGPANTPFYPTVQQHLPAGAEYISAADAPPGPGYTSRGRRFVPSGIQNSYNLPALYAQGFTGKGKTIAIVDSFGYDQAAADLKTFSAAYGLPEMCGMPDVACKPDMPTFSTLQFGNHQVKAPPATSQSPGQEASNAWSLEVALDIEYAHTTAPDANILLVTTPTAETLGVQGLPNMMNAEQYVVDNHLADVVTQSFGAAEGSFASTQSLLNLRHAFISGTAQGMTFLASSGDNGSTGTTKTPVKTGGTLLPTPEVGWPASDPLVTGVGGTNLCTDPQTGTMVDSTHLPAACSGFPGQRETAWNGSGGGFSHVFQRPAYQDQLPAGSAAIPSGARGVPDISMDAAPRTGVVVLDTAPGFGGYYIVGGTSAASPMFAGIVAIADQYAGKNLGQINPALYRLANDPALSTSLFDVADGDNVQAGSGIPGYSAGTGWDAVTGLGTPDAAAFVPALVKAAAMP
ncbi:MULTISPECIES: S53 family peptidase [Arthrobacter]|uniref:S53 family peptidase n=2 Tax=Arthrobacter TaxID=1663 RepID=A0ABU9KJY6_9MICC|nr:S53 family peptidase [Arthrobacter sp. YJM1]MDP5227195.1 S53 family peptidase [Arthrobacter sp. YJM1]